MKKSIKKILSVLLAGAMLATPVTASAFTGTSNFSDKTYTHQDRFLGSGIQQGIDVSYHNGNLNWSVIKAAGVDFAILRAAYRGYGKEGTLVKDTKFAEYIRNAQAQGIPVGAYIYSQAISTAEAVQEANYILNIVSGYNLDLPIVFDYEFAGVKSGRLDSAWADGDIDKSDMTNIALAFCDTVKNAGYDAMVYANKSFLTTNLDHQAIENAGYGVWLAHYTTNTSYTGNFKIWQYTSTGTIPGIANKVFDCNFMYSDTILPTVNVSNIPNQTYTGSEITPAVIVTYGGVTLTEGVDYTLSYQNNIEIGTATVSVYGIGDYSGLIDLTKTFNIVAKPTVKAVTPKVSAYANNYITLTWAKQSAATGYEVYKYNSSTKKYALYKNITSASTGTCKITGLSANTKYYFKLRAYQTENGKKTYSPFGSVVSQYTSPVKPTLSSAKSSSKKKIKASWKKVSGASGYQVMWSTYSSFSKNYKSVNVSKSASSKTVTAAQSKKTYYVRVRAYKTVSGKKIYSPWSATKKLKTK